MEVCGADEGVTGGAGDGAEDLGVRRVTILGATGSVGSSTLDLIERDADAYEVLALTGSASPVVHQPLPIDDPRRRRPDIARADAVLGWRPTTALGDGLRRTIDWFDSEGGEAAPERSALTA